MSALPGSRYEHHRFPAEIISHGVWLYFRFCLSYRDVEELLFARGVIVTDAARRQWCRKFGQAYADQLRRRRPRPGDRGHLDEVFLSINGQRRDLRRAADQEGTVLDIPVQRRTTPTIRPVSESGACRGLSRPGTPSASLPPMGPLRNTSARGGTISPPPSTAKSWGKDSTPNRASRAFPPPHKRGASGGRARRRVDHVDRQ